MTQVKEMEKLPLRAVLAKGWRKVRVAGECQGKGVFILESQGTWYIFSGQADMLYDADSHGRLQWAIEALEQRMTRHTLAGLIKELIRLHDSGPEVWRRATEEAVRGLPHVINRHGEYRLQHHDVLPLLEHDNAALREVGIALVPRVREETAQGGFLFDLV